MCSHTQPRTPTQTCTDTYHIYLLHRSIRFKLICIRIIFVFFALFVLVALENISKTKKRGRRSRCWRKREVSMLFWLLLGVVQLLRIVFLFPEWNILILIDFHSASTVIRLLTNVELKTFNYDYILYWFHLRFANYPYKCANRNDRSLIADVNVKSHAVRRLSVILWPISMRYLCTLLRHSGFSSFYCPDPTMIARLWL